MFEVINLMSSGYIWQPSGGAFRPFATLTGTKLGQVVTRLVCAGEAGVFATRRLGLDDSACCRRAVTIFGKGAAGILPKDERLTSFTRALMNTCKARSAIL